MRIILFLAFSFIYIQQNPVKKVDTTQKVVHHKKRKIPYFY